MCIYARMIAGSAPTARIIHAALEFAASDDKVLATPSVPVTSLVPISDSIRPDLMVTPMTVVVTMIGRSCCRMPSA